MPIPRQVSLQQLLSRQPCFDYFGRIQAHLRFPSKQSREYDWCFVDLFPDRQLSTVDIGTSAARVALPHERHPKHRPKA